MAGLTRIVEQHLRDIALTLDVSPYMVDAPRGFRARFWATMLAAAQARYHHELERLASGRP